MEFSILVVKLSIISVNSSSSISSLIAGARYTGGGILMIF